MSFVLTEGQAKQQIKNLNKTYEGLKTWEQQYGQVDVASQKQASSLTYDYAKAVGDAYASAYENQQAILSSNVGKGYKEQAIQSNDDVLQEAYNAYLQNYQKGLANIEESASEATSQITKNLETEATNTKLMQESAYKYLQYLYKNYSDNPMFQEELWKRYLTTEGENTRLKTWEELSSELYDDEGNLNIKGADFYDQMMNQISQGTYSDTSKYGQITDYYSWLKSENPDLYDWAKSYNPYDYSMYYDPITGEFVNSKEGSFKTMVGLTSSDQTYSFIERYGGMSEKDINSMFNRFVDDVKNIKITDTMDSKDLEEYNSNLKAITTNIKDLSKQLGIEKEIEKLVGGWDNINNQLDKIISRDKSEYEKSTSTLRKIPIIGWIANIFAENLSEVKTFRNLKEYYLSTIQSMITYAQSQRRQKELEYNQG